VPRDLAPTFGIVVPMKNAVTFLPKCLPGVLAAAEAGGGEVVLVDNGSSDGTLEWLTQHIDGRARILEAPGVSISALRNLGAGATSAPVLVFIDADCEVAHDHLARVDAALDATNADAVGSPYVLPVAAHWVEDVWTRLHEAAGDGQALYLPGGNLAVRRQAFMAVGGFDESLATGEDAEFCQRLRRAGFRIHRTAQVRAVHHGNPKSLGAFYRKQRWHALGMFGTTTWAEIDKPVVATIAHGTCLAAAMALLAWPAIPVTTRVGLALLAVNAIPAAAVIYRLGSRAAGRPPWLWAFVLYHLYFAARLSALTRLVARREVSRG
jgi:GT2 family glycosyltransferase